MEISEQYRKLGEPIGEDHAGKRVDLYMAEVFPFLSRSGWQSRMKVGELRIGEQTVRGSYRLRIGDQPWFYHPKSREPEVKRDLQIPWQDGAVMAINKPAPLPMHEGGPYRHNTFAHVLREFVGHEWAAIHRLDRETSGVVLCGATHNVRQQLANEFASRSMDKVYELFAKGRVDWTAKDVDAPIEDLVGSQIRIKKWVVPGGQPAMTRFETIEVKSEYSWVRALPKTGRTNQIRIHMAYAGFPLLGDKLYHPDEQVFLDFHEMGDTDSVILRAGFSRHCLHAKALGFTHPETGKRVTVEAQLPEDMKEFWGGLKS